MSLRDKEMYPLFEWGGSGIIVAPSGQFLAGGSLRVFEAKKGPIVLGRETWTPRSDGRLTTNHSAGWVLYGQPHGPYYLLNFDGGCIDLLINDTRILEWLRQQVMFMEWHRNDGIWIEPSLTQLILAMWYVSTSGQGPLDELDQLDS